MDRRQFLGTAASAVISSAFTSAQAQQAAGRHFVQPRSGVGPYLRTRTGKQPNIFVISADMVSPDLYHPDRPLSKHVRLPNIRSLMKDGTFFQMHSARFRCALPHVHRT